MRPPAPGSAPPALFPCRTKREGHVSVRVVKNQKKTFHKEVGMCAYARTVVERFNSVIIRGTRGCPGTSFLNGAAGIVGKLRN